jgi:hypothetical protein
MGSYSILLKIKEKKIKKFRFQCPYDIPVKSTVIVTFQF